VLRLAMSLINELWKKVSPNLRLITCAAYLAAFICVLIFPSFDRKTEIEEHGLIGHGYASSDFTGAWPKRLRSVIKQIESGHGVAPALAQALEEAELVAHHMNFTTPGGLSSSLTYTVASSRRGDSREAVVVVCAANWTAGKRQMAKASWTLGIGVVLAQFLKTVPWLSKDVFIVFVDGSLPYGAGARAWLRAYLGGTSAVRRGTLRQAVVIDTSSGPATLLIEVEGVNGMVPNQDLVNTFVANAEKYGLPIQHREPWESVFHTLLNGGVHSSHSPFLELHVPAFTVRGKKGKQERASVDVDQFMRSLEGLVRSLSYNLQQLHHSFNFYFFTGPNRHISSGLYLYPVFAMQLPLISFLMTTPAYRDIRSFLVGLGSVAVVILAAGSPIFLLGTNADLASALAGLLPAAGLAAADPPPCLAPSSAQSPRTAAATWLLAGAVGAACAALILRRYAFMVFMEDSPADGAKGGTTSVEEEDVGGKGVQLPSPLWDAVRCSSGFAFLLVLAPITIYSWALAVPLTAISVPVLVLARPFSARRRPLRSLVLLAFLLGNIFLLAIAPEQRRVLLDGAPSRAAEWLYDSFDRNLVPVVPREARQYLPMPLVRWLRQGQLAAALDGDALVGPRGTSTASAGCSFPYSVSSTSPCWCCWRSWAWSCPRSAWKTTA